MTSATKDPPPEIRSLAQLYYLDARDYAERFDEMWERQTHKSGRIKSFIDLLMGCECALKSHVVLSLPDSELRSVYRKVRELGHGVGELASAASLMADRRTYDALAESCSTFKVGLRYSVEFDNRFFSPCRDEPEAYEYGATIGSHDWVLRVRKELAALIDEVSPWFQGEAMEISEILESARLLKTLK